MALLTCACARLMKSRTIPTLDNQAKASLLHGLSWALQAQLASDDPENAALVEAVFLPYREDPARGDPADQ